MSKIPYTLFYLTDDTLQWVDNQLQCAPLGKAYKRHGAYVGYVALKKQIDELKLAHGDKLWYRVMPRFR